MISASICTIGDEILIGQIVDTNSSHISRSLNSLGIKVNDMLSIGDDHGQIISSLSGELSRNDIVITTGGLGPTKDDITKTALAELSGSSGYVEHAGQLEVVNRILKSRGLDVLDINRLQASVPERCEVIVNRVGTAPIMVFRFEASRFGHPATLYSLPGVPFEVDAALNEILDDIKVHYRTDSITHGTVMTYGMAESALSKRIEAWEDSLPADMHLAYLPNQLTGVRLRLSVYGGDREENRRRIDGRFAELRQILGELIYAEGDSSLQQAIAQLLSGTGRTVSVAEACTGGKISQLITSVPEAAGYFLGSVIAGTSQMNAQLLGISEELSSCCGTVSSQMAAAMSEGVRRLTGSTYSVAATGWAGSQGDEREPAGTVWVAASGPQGTRTARFSYRNDRQRNIERFSASALNELRRMIESD